MDKTNQDIPEELNALSERVIGAAIEVHRELGPGMAERVYEEALCHEFGLREINFERQSGLKVSYKGVIVGDHRLDLLVSGSVVIELKAVDAVSDQHLAQLVSYLKAGPYPLGLLLNFGSTLMKNDAHRRINSSCTSSSCLSSSATLRPSAPLRTSSSPRTKS